MNKYGKNNMKFCNKCKVSVRGNRQSCPLCQNNLTGTGEPDIYPDIPTIYRQYTMLFKLLAMGTISVGVISLMLNVMFPESGYWSFFIICGIACFWIMLAFAVPKRNNIPKNITYQVFFLAVFSLIWDYITGWRGWSVDFAIPIIFIVGIAALTIIPTLMKIPVSDYVISLVADGLFGFTPLLFLLLGKVKIVYMSYICITLSILTFISLLLFERKNILTEAQKRFHL